MKYLLAILPLFTYSALFAQKTLASAELEAQNIDKVEIDGSFCDVSIKGGDRNYLNARIVGRGDEGDYSFDTDIVGSTLVVKVRKENRSSWRGNDIRESIIELTITEGIELEIDNSSGDIDIREVTIKPSKIEASSGDLKLIQITGDLEVETSSGDISINGLNGNLEMVSTSGDQTISNVTGNVDTRASSGDIDVIGFKGDVVVEATSGDVDIRGGVGTVSVETTSGDIDGQDIELTGDANFRASSGDVDINFVNDVNELSFDLTATSGSLDAGNESGEKKLYIKRGNYTVTGVTSSGDQEYN